MSLRSGWVVLLFLCFGGVWVSCQNNRVYEGSKAISSEGWRMDDSAEFVIDVTDTVSAHNIIFNVRNTNSYRYANLYIFLDSYYPNFRHTRDTLHFLLADQQGNWIGDRAGEIVDNRFMFREKVRFPKAGQYRFVMSHGMYDETLPEIVDVGVTVEKAQ